MVITGYYDNTSANKQNPDPNQWVGIGSRTADEMSHAWIAVTHLDDQGYEKLVAERDRRGGRRWLKLPLRSRTFASPCSDDHL